MKLPGFSPVTYTNQPMVTLTRSHQTRCIVIHDMPVCLLVQFALHTLLSCVRITCFSWHKVEEAARQRQLEAVDIFLETARAHLKTLSTGTGDGDKQQREEQVTSEPTELIPWYVRKCSFIYDCTHKVYSSTTSTTSKHMKCWRLPMLKCWRLPM